MFYILYVCSMNKLIVLELWGEDDYGLVTIKDERDSIIKAHKEWKKIKS